MKTKTTIDPDLAKAGEALRRAALRARQVAEQTETPFYVMKQGRIVDLNPTGAGSYILREGRRRK